MQTTIQVSGLTKSYSTLHVIRNLDLTVSRGEVFGLLGANGAGKSTAIECMLGTKKADGGSISILGMTSCVKRQPVSTPPPPITENCCSSSVFGKRKQISSVNCPAARDRGFL